jgi:large subunit ribosomal protein L5
MAIKNKIEKIVINTGLGNEDKEGASEEIQKALSLISGQKAIPTKAKKAISAFDLAEDELSGFKVTLRGKRKDDFFDKLYKIVLPRKKDFSGIPRDSFDPDGNLTLGFPDAKVFPELKDKHDLHDFGLETTIVTSTTDKEEAIKFLKEKGLPVQEKSK